MAPCGPLRGPDMSKWKEEKAEKNRRSLVRLNKALPSIFPSAVLSRALGRPFVTRTPRLAIDSYWAHIPFAPIAWRVRLLPAAEHQAAGAGASATVARAACLLHSEHHPRPIGNTHMRLDPAFTVYAGNLFIASAGTSIYARPGPTRMRSGTAPAWSRGNSGVPQ